MERHQGLKSGEHGKDESSSIKLLTRHKGVELEIDTYSGIIQVKKYPTPLIKFPRRCLEVGMVLSS